MFSRIKKLFLGDKRPIDREIDHPILGKLKFSDDDEEWFTDPSHNDVGFRLSIGGDWDGDAETVSPAYGLTRWAEEIVGDAKAFLAELHDFMEAEKAGKYKAFSVEIEALRIDFFSLGPEKRPGEGSIYFKAVSEGRCWYCDYLNKKPTLLGFDR